MYNRLYHQFTAVLARQVERAEHYLNQLPNRSLWIGSVIVIFLLAALFASLLFFSGKQPATYLFVKAIHVPAHVLPQPSTPRDSSTKMALAFHLQRLLYQLDSLKSHPETKYLYDSLMRTHPGLRDSLIEAQHLFLHPFMNMP